MPQKKIRPIDGAHRAVGQESGLLSDIEILARLVATDESCIFISPLIDPVTQLGPSSLDLRLGREVITTRTIASTHIDLMVGSREIEEQVRAYSENMRLDLKQYFVLHPGSFVLASTLEYLCLPKDIAGRLEGRSSLGRLGLQVHATAGFVDPGFEGTLTFELMNSGKLPAKMPTGMRLGQICFFKVNDTQVPYSFKKASKYGKKLGVERTRIATDPEMIRPSEKG
jgi:dCTP deaminase